MKIEKLKPCPFCGEEEKLDVSMKTATKKHDKSQYHACVYCKTCHTYGKRVLCYSYDYWRLSVEDKQKFEEQAKQAWNERVKDEN